MAYSNTYKRLLRNKYAIFAGGGDWSKNPGTWETIGNVSGSLIDTTIPPDNYGVKPQGAAIAGGALKGAGQGAAQGAVIGSIIPGVGTVIGGAVGAVAGGLYGGITAGNENSEAKRQRDRYMHVVDSAVANRSRNILQNYDTTGNNEHQIYRKFGGPTPISDYFKYPIGGNVSGLSNDSFEVAGRDHEEGGIKFPNQGIELEDGESVNNDFVFSEELGFAAKHKPIARIIGRVEKRPMNNERRNTLNLLKAKEEALKQEQESLKESLGLNNESMVGNYV